LFVACVLRTAVLPPLVEIGTDGNAHCVCRATRNKVSLVLMLLMLVGVIVLMIYELVTRE
jgi:hypothetical protein